MTRNLFDEADDLLDVFDHSEGSPSDDSSSEEIEQWAFAKAEKVANAHCPPSHRDKCRDAIIALMEEAFSRGAKKAASTLSEDD